MSLRVKYVDVPQGAQEAAQVEGQGQPFSDMSLVASGANDVAYATLEPEGWPLDGSRHIMPDGVRTGFWSQSVSVDDSAVLGRGILGRMVLGRQKASCQFDDPPVITVSLPEKYTATGISIVFSPSTGEWCTEIRVSWYSGNDLLVQETAYPTQANWTVQKAAENFDRVTVELISTNIAGHFAKVQCIEIGQTIWFDKDELSNVHLINEIDPTLSDLTVDTMQVKVQDKIGRALIPQKNQKMELYRNENLLAVQYIETSKREARSSYTFSCQSAIGLLEDDYMGGIYNAVSVAEVLGDILNGFEYELDSKYYGMTVTGYLPICTRREALQQVMFTVGAVATTQRGSAIRIVPLSTAIVGFFQKNEIFQGGSVETALRVAKIEVVAHTYAASKETETLLEEEGIYGEDVLVTFDNPHHSYFISGGTLTGSGANWVTITASGPVTLEGKKYLHSTTRYTKRNPDATTAERNNVHSVESATLIHHENAALVLDRLYNISMLRQTLTQEAVITTQRAGDRVTSESPWGGQVRGYISAMESDFTQTGHTASVTIIGAEVDASVCVMYAGELFAGDMEVLW